jgi:hypothetical protein
VGFVLLFCANPFYAGLAALLTHERGAGATTLGLMSIGQALGIAGSPGLRTRPRSAIGRWFLWALPGAAAGTALLSLPLAPISLSLAFAALWTALGLAVVASCYATIVAATRC